MAYRYKYFFDLQPLFFGESNKRKITEIKMTLKSRRTAQSSCKQFNEDLSLLFDRIFKGVRAPLQTPENRFSTALPLQLMQNKN
jgi:hypothetical protein